MIESYGLGTFLRVRRIRSSDTCRPQLKSARVQTFSLLFSLDTPAGALVTGILIWRTDAIWTSTVRPKLLHGQLVSVVACFRGACRTPLLSLPAVATMYILSWGFDQTESSTSNTSCLDAVRSQRRFRNKPYCIDT